MNRILIIIFSVLLLVGCSDNINEQTKEESNQVTKNTKEEQSKPESTDVESLIGETLKRNDGVMELPFKEVVLEAVFSKDERVKLLRTKEMIVLINEDKIIHAGKIKHYDDKSFASIMVSDDGRFATWRDHLNEDWEISIYDVDNQNLEIIKKTQEVDPYGIVLLPKIVKEADTYYFINNQHKFGYDLENAVNLNDKKILSIGNEEDKEMLAKLSPKEAVTTDEVYDKLNGDMRMAGKKRGYEADLPRLETDDGYYEVYFDYDDQDEEIYSITEIIAADVQTGRITNVPIQKEIDLTQENIELLSNKVGLGENGSMLMPVVKKEQENNTLVLYYTDLSKDAPKVHILLEEVMDTEEDTPEIIFNSDETGFYLSKKGKLEYHDLNK